MTTGLMRVLDGNTFVLSDDRGDIAATRDNPSGFFSFDTRFLSQWRLSVNGERLHALAADVIEYFETRFFLAPGAPTHYIDAKVSVIRHRSVGGSAFEETLTVLNHDYRPVDYVLRLDVGADFADLLEVRQALQKKGSVETRVEDRCLCLSYRRERFHRETRIATTRDAQIDEGGLTFAIRVGAGESWETCLRVEAVVLGAAERDLRKVVHGDRPRGKPQMRQDLANWLDRAPHLECDSRPLATTYRCSLVDLAALRHTPLAFPNESIPAAGLPWFMSTFGRDSLVASLQALPFAPDLAATTLRLLAFGQGSHVDDFRDEEPGKILLEFRYGETAAFEEQPHSPYHGTADSTPLFLILLDEYERWSGNLALVRNLEPEARAALGWIDAYGDRMGNGYLSYQRPNLLSGLENQCWKTSKEAISYRDGRLPGFPRATCELQGYTYDAKMRTARLARVAWNDPALAERLEKEAAELKERFNRDFWVADGGYYALALDGDGNQVDALSSNIGHLLWSGIVEEAKAEPVARHLLGPRLFSGWGVRTLADGEGRYNPIGYHVGTVWPFDNSFIAWGLRRYGFDEEAARIAEAMIEASSVFQGRLPEAFGGYDRDITKYPVPYRSACSPHAWSAGASLLLLRTMLGLEPHEDHLSTDPALPATMGHIELLDISGRWGRADAFARGRMELPDRQRRRHGPRAGSGRVGNVRPG